MKENLDPELVKQWDKKLVEAGLPSEEDINKPDKVPVEAAPALSIDERGMSSEKMEGLFKDLDSLPEKFQINILEELKTAKAHKASYAKIVDVFETYIAQGKQLMAKYNSLPTDISDAVYIPQPPRKDEEDEGFKEEIKDEEKKVDEILERVEKIIIERQKRDTEGAVN